MVELIGLDELPVVELSDTDCIAHIEICVRLLQ